MSNKFKTFDDVIMTSFSLIIKGLSFSFEKYLTLLMVHSYSKIPQNPERCMHFDLSLQKSIFYIILAHFLYLIKFIGCKARGDDLRVHFKLTHEAAAALKGMTLIRAKKYLNNVLNHKEIIPFRRYRYGVSRHAQVHQFHVS